MFMSYDLTIPVWGIILFAIPFIGGGIWILVRMFFAQKTLFELVNLADKRMDHADMRHDKLERDFNENIIKVRTEFEKELEKVNSNIAKMLEKQIETQTLVKLLVEKKIS